MRWHRRDRSDAAVLLHAGVEVDWQNEQRCFSSFMREIAFLYEPGPSHLAKETTEAEQFTIRHVLFPALKQCACGRSWRS